MDERTDEDLVRDALAGQDDSFACLVGKYQDYAYGTAVAVLGDFDLARDVVQEAFLCAYRTLGTLKEPARFVPHSSASCRVLTPEDRPVWQRFVDRNAGDPMVKAPNRSQAVVRDFLFMCMGLPVKYFATLEDGEMTGMASVLYVDPVHRRRGLARTLLCAAVQHVHGQERVIAYHAAGGPQERPDLYGLLTSLGFTLVACLYTTELDWQP